MDIPPSVSPYIYACMFGYMDLFLGLYTSIGIYAHMYSHICVHTALCI